MSRKFIATILAASLTVTAFSARPAQALSEDQLGALLFGGATLLILGQAISSRSEPNDITVRPNPVYRDSEWNWNRSKDKVRVKRSRSTKILPSYCLRHGIDQRKRARVFGEQCLRESYRFTSQLPRACKSTLRTKSGPRTGYKPSCLRRYGYRVTSH